MSILIPNLSPIEKAELLVKNEVLMNVSRMVSKLVHEEAHGEGLYPVMSRECLAAGVDSFGIQVMQRGADWIYRYDKEESVEYSTQQDAIEAAASTYNIEPRTIEALVHYVVSDWLADRLEERGEMIVRDFLDTFNIWGRTTFGQCIYMDGVISAIVAHNEPLSSI